MSPTSGLANDVMRRAIVEELDRAAAEYNAALKVRADAYGALRQAELDLDALLRRLRNALIGLPEIMRGPIP